MSHGSVWRLILKHHSHCFVDPRTPSLSAFFKTHANLRRFHPNRECCPDCGYWRVCCLISPQFLGWLNQKKVDDALAKIEGAIKETQREAIKRSQDCTIKIPKGIDQSISGDCLVTGNRQIEEVTISHNATDNPWELKFDFKGEYKDIGVTLWVTVPNSSVKPKCLAISKGIGLMRTGNYDLVAAKCIRP